MATAADVAKAEFAQSYIAHACIFEFRYLFNWLADDQQFSGELIWLIQSFRFSLREQPIGKSVKLTSHFYDDFCISLISVAKFDISIVIE